MGIIDKRIAKAGQFLPNDNPEKYKQYLLQKPKPTGKFSFNSVKFVQSFRIDKPIERNYVDIKAGIDESAEREARAIKVAFKPHTIDFGKRVRSGIKMGNLGDTPKEVHFREVWKKVTL